MCFRRTVSRVDWLRLRTCGRVLAPWRLGRLPGSPALGMGHSETRRGFHNRHYIGDEKLVSDSRFEAFRTQCVEYIYRSLRSLTYFTSVTSLLYLSYTKDSM
jgi:hypothetical protein